MCPRCHSSRVRRSRRQLLDYVLRLFGVKPMRCRTCLHRYRLWSWSRRKEDEASAASAAAGSGK